MLAARPAVPAVPARLDVQRRRCTALPLASAPAVPSLRVASRARRLLQCAARRGEREAEPQPPPPPADEEFGDFFPGADSVRAWQALESETKMVIQLAAGFFAVPALLSLSLRAAVIDPMLYLLQADFQDFNLTQRQWKELTLEVDALERRFRYDARMGHAPPLSDAQLEERLREEGLRLEDGERQRCREAVGNTLSDSLGTGLLFTGFWLNRSRLRLLRKGLAARFLSLEVSTQAFLLLLAADVTVGYHSSDGWVTFVEVLVTRYNVDGAEAANNAIRLFVAVVPVVIDVTFKWWVYKYLRKLSPGTQIILSEIERH